MLGAIIGDTVGSRFEFNNLKSKDFELITKDSELTDDSIMTLAVAGILLNNKINDPDAIIDTLKEWGNLYPYAGYGGMFRKWLFTDYRKPYNSFGNGAAMRISPVGFLAKSEEEVIDWATKVTEVTHNHPEGIKGAVVTAMCIYYARIGKDKEFIRKYVKKHYDVNFDYEELKKSYYFNELCQTTVPQAIYCFLISKNYEDCIRTCVSIGGDTDTVCAIAGGIAEAYYKIPLTIKFHILKYLDERQTNMITKYYNKLESQGE
jgi:type I restriction enzyme M protein